MEALVEKKVLLEKIPGKGGWTYAKVPEIKVDSRNPFGWRKVKGLIDDYQIKSYHLMSIGNGELFLPVKAAIRKSIRKEAGDYVKIILFVDDTPFQTPVEFSECLDNEPEALAFFNSLNDSNKKKYVDWIYLAKRDTTRIERITKSIDLLKRKTLLAIDIVLMFNKRQGH